MAGSSSAIRSEGLGLVDGVPARRHSAALLFVGLVGVARKDSGASTGGEVYRKLGWFVGENWNRKDPVFFHGKNPWVSGRFSLEPIHGLHEDEVVPCPK